MGMSASQARLLTLTARQHDVEWKAQKLQAEKLRLANDSDRVYNSYLESLSATKIQARVSNQWESDTFKDASLAMIEHGLLTTPDITCAATPLFLQETGINGATSILVTQKIADQYNISPTDAPWTGTMDEFFYEVGGLTDDLHKKVVGTYDAGGIYEYVDGTVASYQGVANTNYVPYSRNLNDTGAVAVTSSGLLLPNCDTFKNEVTDTDKIDTSGMTNLNSGVSTLTATSYCISDAAGLIHLATLVNNGADTTGVKIYLSNDIDMTGIAWSGIGSFKGTFDGNGCVINNLKGSQGLFSKLESTAVVKNVGLENVDISNSHASGTGGIAGKNAGLIQNCYVTGNLTARGHIGGIVGENISDTSSTTTAKIVDCNATITINASSVCNGGISGHNSGEVLGCNSTGQILGTGTWGGGLVGHNSETTVIKDCTTGVSVNLTGESVSSQPHHNGIVIGYNEPGHSLTINNIAYLDNSTNNICGNEDDSNWTTGIFKKGISVPYIDTTDGSGDFAENILAALIKHGDVDINDDTDLATAETKIKNYVLALYNTGSDADLINIANINDRIYDYITGDTSYDETADTNFMNALAADVSTSLPNQTLDTGFQTKYNTSEHRAVISSTTNYDCINEVKGKITIPSKATMKATMTAALVKSGLPAGNAETCAEDFFNQYDWTDPTDKAYLAKINDILVRFGSNSCTTETLNLLNSANVSGSPTRYEVLPSYIDDPDHYDISVNESSGDIIVNREQTYVPNYVDITDWNYDLPEVQEVLQKYILRKVGIKIIDDTQAYSTNWLTNMVNCGLAQFAYFDINSAMKTNPDGTTSIDTKNMSVVGTSVANETSLQEVQDTENIKKAEATYEANMRKINRKETRIDTELSTLDAERTSIKAEQETLKTVAKDNVDMTFKLFS